MDENKRVLIAGEDRGVLRNLITGANSVIKQATQAFKEGFDPPKSQGRRLKTFVEAGGRERKDSDPLMPTGIGVRMMDGRPMRYWTDGSLRHAISTRGGLTRRERREVERAARKRARHA